MPGQLKPTPMTQRAAPRALIAGGSIAGLFTAALLHRQGWEVDVLERSPRSLESQGAGFVQQADLVRALRALGVANIGQLGVTAFERVVLDRNGNFLDRDRTPQTQHAWDSLYRVLRQHLPEAQYHLGASVTAVHQDGDRVSATLADGRQFSGDLLVAADGTLSTVRRLLEPASLPTYAGYVAWRGLIPEDELTALAATDLAGRFAFFRYPGSHILGYLIPGPNGETEAGQRRYNWVWYRPAPAGAAIDSLLTDRSGRRHYISMPAQGLDPAAKKEMQNAAAEHLPPSFLDAVLATDTPFVQAIQDLEAPRMAYGRVALVGDAASVVRPHTAMGIDKGAGDAFFLAEALHGAGNAGDSVPAALAAWAPARLARAGAIAAHGQQLGAALEPDPALGL